LGKGGCSWFFFVWGGCCGNSALTGPSLHRASQQRLIGFELGTWQGRLSRVIYKPNAVERYASHHTRSEGQNIYGLSIYTHPCIYIHYISIGAYLGTCTRRPSSSTGRQLKVPSGIIGQQPFWAKSWPGAFWSQILGLWWLASRQLKAPSGIMGQAFCPAFVVWDRTSKV